MINRRILKTLYVILGFNKLDSEFDLKGSITLVPANKAKTCEK